MLPPGKVAAPPVLSLHLDFAQLDAGVYFFIVSSILIIKSLIDSEYTPASVISLLFFSSFVRLIKMPASSSSIIFNRFSRVSFKLLSLTSRSDLAHSRGLY